MQNKRTSYTSLKQSYTIILATTTLFFLQLYLATMRALITTPAFRKQYAGPHCANCMRAVPNVNIGQPLITCAFYSEYMEAACGKPPT